MEKTNNKIKYIYTHRGNESKEIASYYYTCSIKRKHNRTTTKEQHVTKTTGIDSRHYPISYLADMKDRHNFSGKFL